SANDQRCSQIYKKLHGIIMDESTSYIVNTPQHIAQLNIGRLRHETDDPRMADFMNNLARINALAERSPGFVWRYTDATGNATDTRPYAGDPRMAINMSVWESVEALEKFVWQSVHTRF